MSIKLDNIYRNFGEFKLHINLEIHKGQLISLLGPSGCGKSTTLRIIAGFEEPENGTVYIDDTDIGPIPAEKRNIGMVFQDYALFPHMTVYDNIAYGPKLRKWHKEKIAKSVKKFVKLTHLEGLEHRRTENLSGGEQQRVALARALVTEPKLLLLDEPLSALDAKLRKSLRREIRRIQKELGITTIYVTHDQEEALAMSDKIALMSNGKCLQFDSPRTIYTQPSGTFSASFLGSSNIVDSMSFDPDKKICQSKIGPFEVSFVKSDNPQNKLFFRPENCIVTSEPHSLNCFKGKIIDCEYSGFSSHYLLDCSGEYISIISQADQFYEQDEELYISVSPKHCRLL